MCVFISMKGSSHLERYWNVKKVAKNSILEIINRNWTSGMDSSNFLKEQKGIKRVGVMLHLFSQNAYERTL